MRARTAAAALVAGALVGLSALPAGAGATICYSASVTVAGTSVVDQTNMPDCTTVDTP